MMLWVLLLLQPFVSLCEGCVSETCGLPPQPAETSDAFASIQVMGKQTTEKELDDKVVVEHIYKLNEDGTVTIIFKYEDGTEEVFDVLDPHSPGLLQEQRSQEGFPWKKIWKIKKIKEALGRRRQHPSSSCTSGDFSFSFPNDNRNESAEATSVRVLTNEAGFGLGEYISDDQDVFSKTFNVSASCEIVPRSFFLSFNITSSRSLILDFLPFNPVPCAGLSNSTSLESNCSDVKFQYIS
ncbi:unnamed protein product [Cladocopium goreaui]|uniref:Uncharacterized protein n=1 Tax=Cladocopium goreaui TaxID=2562237 RepID=A0A9P1D7P4_9DINO|nr:unnamed protein product [Cladocopium goreaui]